MSIVLKMGDLNTFDYKCTVCGQKIDIYTILNIKAQ